LSDPAFETGIEQMNNSATNECAGELGLSGTRMIKRNVV